MKFLNIVLYSNPNKNNHYDSMKKMTSYYYKRFGEKVKTLYIRYDELDESDELTSELANGKRIQQIDDNFVINGKESYIPGILNKTLDTFDYMISENMLDDYDYCIRTNISTIVNYDILEEELSKNPIEYYGGGRSMVLNWKSTGMEDERWFGTVFVQGTSIILSKKAVQLMSSKRDKFRTEIIDDVALAIFAKEHMPSSSYPPQMIKNGLFKDIPRCIDNDNIHNTERVKKAISLSKNNTAFYRNKCLGIHSPNRLLDLINMKVIIEELLTNNK